jgi:hypothetical protein
VGNVGAEPRPGRDGRPVSGRPRVPGVVLTGWNADQFGRLCSAAASTARGCGWGTRWGVRPVVGTLLGPEGAGSCAGVDGNVCRPVGGVTSCRGRPGPRTTVVVGVTVGGGRRWRVGGACPGVAGWSLRTAQWTRASSFDCVGAPRRILKPVPPAHGFRARVVDGGGCGVCCGCVAKLLRAHGGCLGTRSR